MSRRPETVDRATLDWLQRLGAARPMQPLNRREYRRLAQAFPYYRGRWRYLKRVIRLIREEHFDSVLELGPGATPIVHGADTMGIRQIPNLTWLWDAGRTPWPVEDGKYDLFIALQVWEHLEDRQKEAFAEVMRVARRAILSFPLNWHCPGDCHHGITEQTVAEWTRHVPPVRRVHVVSGRLPRRLLGLLRGRRIRRRTRAIYVFRFEP